MSGERSRCSERTRPDCTSPAISATVEPPAGGSTTFTGLKPGSYRLTARANDATKRGIYAFTAAEESTAWSGVTRPVHELQRRLEAYEDCKGAGCVALTR